MIEITVATVISDVKRHLSVIGKRMYNKEGKNIFSDITLSSAEDTKILTHYINASAQDIEAALKPFTTSATYGATVRMAITNTRGDADFEQRTKDMSESYITLNTVGEYLAMVHPDLAQKYQADARQRMESLIMYVIFKQAPEVPLSPSNNPYSYADVTGDLHTNPYDGNDNNSGGDIDERPIDGNIDW